MNVPVTYSAIVGKVRVRNSKACDRWHDLHNVGKYSIIENR